jgi:serine protease AprX
MICPTTGQSWWSSSSWTITGTATDYHYFGFSQTDFSGYVTGNTNLDFTVELWNSSKTTLLASDATVSGEPVKADYIPPTTYNVIGIINNFVGGTDADADGYYETYTFQIGIDADATPGPTTIYGKMICTTTGQSWWSSTSWTVTGTTTDYHYFNFSQSDFAGYVTGNTNLDFTVEMWNSTKTTLLDSDASVSGEPVKADYIPPTTYNVIGIINNFVGGADADADGYYETYTFQIGIDADATPGPTTIYGKMICTTTGQSWWSSTSWTVTGTTTDYHYFNFSQSDFSGYVTGNTNLDFTVEMWNSTKTTLLDSDASVSGEPVKADYIPTSTYDVFGIINAFVGGTDADSDGYYETYSFQIGIDGDANPGPATVYGKMICNTTGQSWWSSASWTVTGATIDYHYFGFDQTNFSGYITGNTNLDFTVELWNSSKTTLLASDATVSGEPVKVDYIPVTTYAIYGIIDNFVGGTDADADGYYETYTFQIGIDGDATPGPATVYGKMICPTTGQSWWSSSSWTITGTVTDYQYFNFSQTDFSGYVTGNTSLEFTVELWNSTKTTLLASDASVSGEPVKADYIAPINYSVYGIINNFVGGADADADGYYETYTFQIGIDGDRSSGSATVYGKMICPTTGQSWWSSSSWTITGTATDYQYFGFSQTDFSGYVTGNTNLDFTVELWNSTKTTLLASDAGVTGEPVKADYIDIIPPDISVNPTVLQIVQQNRQNSYDNNQNNDSPTTTTPIISKYCEFEKTGIQERLYLTIENSNSDSLIPVIIQMDKIINFEYLIDKYKNIVKNEKKAKIIFELKEFSELYQSNVINYLSSLTFGVNNVQVLWSINSIGCELSPSVIQIIGNYENVACIWMDDVLSMPFNETLIDPQDIKENRANVWNLNLINADDVWNLGYNGSGVVCGLIDTGVNYDHTDLQDHMWNGGSSFPNHGFDFINNDNDPMDTNGHGTHCAGTVAGDGSSGTSTGVAPNCQVMAVKAVPGSLTVTTNAVQFCLDHGADLISMSAGWAYYDNSCNFQSISNDLRISLRNLGNTVLSTGIVWAVASGNDADCPGANPPDLMNTPADVPGPWQGQSGHSSVISVGATDSNDNIADFSNFGPAVWNISPNFNDYPSTNPLIKPNIVAPGVNITSLSFNNNTGYVSGWSGTSMATPHIAGVIALMLDKEPSLTPSQIDQILSNSAVDLGNTGIDNLFGAGRVNALAAINAMSGNENSFTITNVGGSVLTVTSISDNKNWLSTSGYPSSPFNIAAGGSQPVNISVDWVLVGTTTQTGTITIASNDPDETSVTVQVTVIPTIQCNLTVTPSNRNVTYSAGSTTFSVTSNCSWTASSNQTWCTVTPSGTGNGTITATYTENPNTSQRIANITVTVDGVTPIVVTVTQAARPCTLAVTPSNQNVTYSAGTTNFSVTSNCSWTALSNQTWCTITPSGNGNGTLTANYTINNTANTRIANITVTVSGIAPVVVTVTQAPMPTLSVSPSNRDVPWSPEGSTTFSVTSNSNWTASSSQTSWCTVTPSGSGNGTIIANYTVNNTASTRIANITVTVSGIAPVVVTVTQGSPSTNDILTLNAGWNLISFDITLNPNTPAEVFQTLITANNLQTVTGYQNQQGVFFDPTGLPFLNTLQSIIQGEGYWVKVQNAATLTVQGTAIPANLTINLLSGWNLISYWRPSTTTPATAFAALISAGKLQMVTGYEQGGKFFDPNGPTFLNTLTEIKNGFGYWVKVNSNCTLTFP